jgi:uncharacterized protein with ParB-like and HNH nuclease domain
MSAEAQVSKAIDGKGKTIRELLANRKYSIDYYQREYKWEAKQLAELIDDLCDKFFESYDPTHERPKVKDYGHYFLGSIIISAKGTEKFVIDGQQRLTTITLLLIYLRNLAQEEQKGLVADLIFSVSYGQRNFNLDVPDRTACMESLYLGTQYQSPDDNESVANILARYSEIDDGFPSELKEEALPFFTDWLIENVHLVEITAYTDGDAYTIFETMNDRGLSLTPADMLKGYLLANISDQETRTSANSIWKKRTVILNEIGKDEDDAGIKAWLRGQYAESIRENKRGAVPKDFDLIGTEFHRWVRDQEERIGLRNSSEFSKFIESDFVFYSKEYERLLRASRTLTPNLESVYLNNEHNFTLQYPLILAAINKTDDELTVSRKIRVVSSFVDILIHRRLWTFKAVDYRNMRYAMFNVIKDIRGKSLEELADLLTQRLATEPQFSDNQIFRLTSSNRKQVHRILARITDYLETQSGYAPRYLEYAKRGRQNAYEIEHIWADHPERHSGEFAHKNDFAEYRNRLGDLLLLPKSFNASFGDKTYEEKRPHYVGQNLLARSLCSEAYQNNPGFLGFKNESGLAFRPLDEFQKADIDERQSLYIELVSRIWDVQRLHQDIEFDFS